MVELKMWKEGRKRRKRRKRSFGEKTTPATQKNSYSFVQSPLLLNSPMASARSQLSNVLQEKENIVASKHAPATSSSSSTAQKSELAFHFFFFLSFFFHSSSHSFSFLFLFLAEGLQIKPAAVTVPAAKPKGLKDVTNKKPATTTTKPTVTKLQNNKVSSSLQSSQPKPTPSSFFNLDLDLDTHMEYCPPSLSGTC